MDGLGQPLDKHEMLSAIKVHWQSIRKTGGQREDYDELADLLGHDILEQAHRLIEKSD